MPAMIHRELQPIRIRLRFQHVLAAITFNMAGCCSEGAPKLRCLRAHCRGLQHSNTPKEKRKIAVPQNGEHGSSRGWQIASCTPWLESRRSAWRKQEHVDSGDTHRVQGVSSELLDIPFDAFPSRSDIPDLSKCGQC